MGGAVAVNPETRSDDLSKSRNKENSSSYYSMAVDAVGLASFVNCQPDGCLALFTLIMALLVMSSHPY